MLAIEKHPPGIRGESGARHPYRPLDYCPGQANSVIDPRRLILFSNSFRQYNPHLENNSYRLWKKCQEEILSMERKMVDADQAISGQRRAECGEHDRGY